jgi:hypothetical protein
VASVGCLRLKETSPRSNRASATPSATSPLISPKCVPKKASYACLWPSPASRSSPMRSCIQAPDKIGADNGQTPLLPLPGLHGIFLSVRRTVSSETLSTTRNSTNLLANSCMVQHFRPSGGVLQANSIRECLLLVIGLALGAWPRLVPQCGLQALLHKAFAEPARPTWNAAAIVPWVAPASACKRMWAHIRGRAAIRPILVKASNHLRSAAVNVTPCHFVVIGSSSRGPYQLRKDHRIKSSMVTH